MDKALESKIVNAVLLSLSQEQREEIEKRNREIMNERDFRRAVEILENSVPLKVVKY